MVDNQHQKIDGYRDLTEEEISVMNRVKIQGAELQKLIQELANLKSIDVDPRWLAIGKTNLQQGIMALVRSVAKPNSF